MAIKADNAGNQPPGNSRPVGAESGAQRPKKIRNTRFSRRPGVRQMKEFPVTSRELWTLGGLQASSAASVGFSGWLISFWTSSQQAIDFAGKDAPKEVIAQWHAYSDMAFYGAAASAILALFLVGLSGFNVWGIIRDTEHGPS